MTAVLTDRELDIMHVLWEQGSATAAEVRDALADPLAYNTVLTMLRILEEKGHVDHKEEGRAFRYYPRTARRIASRSAVRKLVDTLFDGSPSLLVTELVRDRKLSKEELRELRSLLEERLAEREDS